MQIELKQNNQVIMTGHPADVKEKVQDLFELKYGMYPDFQESDVEFEEEYYIYLHTDSYEELEEADLEKLDELKITDDPESTTEALKKLLEIDFKIII